MVSLYGNGEKANQIVSPKLHRPYFISMGEFPMTNISPIDNAALNILCSYGTRVNNHTLTIKSFKEILERTQRCINLNQVNKLRNISDEFLKKDFKQKNFDYFVMGRFKDNIRQNENLISISHFLFDADHLTNAVTFKERLKENENVLVSFISPSGDGVKFIIPTDKDITNPEQYKNIYRKLRSDLLEEYKDVFLNPNSILDDRCSNVQHPCFISSDPDIYLNENAKPVCIDDYKYSDNNVQSDHKYVLNNQDKSYLTNISDNFLIKRLTDVTEFLKGKIKGHKDWLCVCFSLANLGVEGGHYFRTISMDNQLYPNDTIELIDRQFNECLKRYDSRKTNINKIFSIARKYGYKPPKELEVKSVKQKDILFWYVSEENDLKIDHYNLKNFLEHYGFGKYYVGNSYIIIRKDNNIVEEMSISKIKDFIISYVNKLDSKVLPERQKHLLINALMRGKNVYFSNDAFEFLNIINLKYHVSNRNESYFYFQNYIIKVTATQISKIEYKDLDGVIWKSQIINHKIDLTDEPIGEYYTFLYNVCNNDEKRFKCLFTINGYLLHDYKDKAFAPAIILTDELLSDFPEGGTGKGIFLQGLGQVRNMTREDGKNFRFDKNFAFQKISLDTKLFSFEDVGSRFDFEKLFSIITDGISVEKKNKDEFRIPFEKSPKVIITTNYAVQGEGNSHKRRRVEFEFSQYYNQKNTPMEEFGHLLFEDWNYTEWNNFYNVMLFSVQKYLSNGVFETNQINLQRKKFIQTTSKDFVEWYENGKDKFDKTAKTLREDFKIDYDDSVSPQKFNKWLRAIGTFIDSNTELKKIDSEGLKLIKK